MRLYASFQLLDFLYCAKPCTNYLASKPKGPSQEKSLLNIMYHMLSSVMHCFQEGTENCTFLYLNFKDRADVQMTYKICFLTACTLSVIQNLPLALSWQKRLYFKRVHHGQKWDKAQHSSTWMRKRQPSQYWSCWAGQAYCSFQMACRVGRSPSVKRQPHLREKSIPCLQSPDWSQEEPICLGKRLKPHH